MKTPSRLIVLLVVSSSIFFEALDIAIVNLAMPVIQTDFGLSSDTVQWMQTLYVICYGGFLILGGKLSDVWGRKRVFMTGSAIFLVTSFAAGIAGSFLWVCVARAFQGLGAAFVMPAAFSIITNTYPDPTERSKAIGIFGSFAAIGSGSGLSLGGIIATYAGWQWVFFINVPVISLAMLLGAFVITPDGKQSRQEKFDMLSAILLTTSLLLLTFLIHELKLIGENPALFLGSLLLFVVLALSFFKRIRRDNPLIDLKIFNTRGTLTGNVTMLMMGAFFTGFLFLISVVLQKQMGFTAATSGLLLLPFSILSAMVSKSVVPRLLKKISVMQTAIVGMLLMTLGGASLIFSSLLSFPLVSVLVSVFFVTGTGIAVCFASLTVISMQDVPMEQHGLAGSLFNTNFFFGGGLGLSIIGFVMQLQTDGKLLLPIIVLTSYAIAGLIFLFLRNTARHRKSSEIIPA